LTSRAIRLRREGDDVEPLAPSATSSREVRKLGDKILVFVAIHEPSLRGRSGTSRNDRLEDTAVTADGTVLVVARS